MEEESLNRKRAEWAGFKYEAKVSDTCSSIPECWKLLNRVFWKLPDFPHSLDACFTWLVPKAIDRIMAEQGCSSDVAYAILFKKWLQELELIIPNAALALCLAIEKLFGKEEKVMDWDSATHQRQCPKSKQTAHYPVVRCNLNDKFCILETDGYCPTYDDWLFEQRQKELDHPEGNGTIGFVPTWLQEFEKEAKYDEWVEERRRMDLTMGTGGVV